MPIFTVEGKHYAAWNEAAQRKLKIYSLADCLSNFQLTRGTHTITSKQNKGQQEAHTQSQPDAVVDEAQALRKHITGKQAIAMGPMGGFDVLAKHWESHLKDLKPAECDHRTVQFKSLFAYTSCHGHSDTSSFVSACIHSLLSGYTVVTSGLYDDSVLEEALHMLLRSTELNTLSRIALSTSETEAKLEQFWEALKHAGVDLYTSTDLVHTKDAMLKSNFINPPDSVYDPNADVAASGYIGMGTLQVSRLLRHQGSAETGLTEEYRFTTAEELSKKNHQPPVIITVNLSTNASLISSLVDLLVTLFRTKSYQKELAGRLHLLKQTDTILLPCAGHSVLQSIWQHLQTLALEFMTQYLHLHNLKASDLLQKQNDAIDFQSNEERMFEVTQISRLVEFLPSILSKRTIRDDIDKLMAVLPCVKLPRYIHVQLDCSGLSAQAFITSAKQPSLTSLLTLLLAIPQATVSIKQPSLNRIHALSPSDHSRFRIKYIRSLSIANTYSSAIAELNEKVKCAMLSMNENMLIKKAIKESTITHESQSEALFRALEAEGTSAKDVNDRNIAQIGIILNHLSVKSKARITLRHLLELQEQKMKANGHNLRSTELATDGDSVCVDELKESLLDTTQNKSVIILAGQTIESILTVFIDTESILDGGIQKSKTGTKTRLESPLRRTQDCDTIGLYVVCTYTGIITLLDMIDAQN